MEYQRWICLEELAKERGRKKGKEGERRLGEGRRKEKGWSRGK